MSTALTRRTYLRYAPELETPAENEAKLFEDIAAEFRKVTELVRKQEGHAVRPSHAKSTGVLKGELVIGAGLPVELAQGLFARAVRYPVLVRLAQGPGELLHDRISTHRGMALKVLGVSGDRIQESAEGSSQDWVLEAGNPSFINSNANTFYANLRAGVSNAPHLPQAVKAGVSSVARAANAALEAVGLESKTLGFFGHPPLHPLAETYFSQAPIRWGDYVAKLGLFPCKATLDSISEIKIADRSDINAFRTAVVNHFAGNGAQFDVRAQLATSVGETPVEDAAVDWPQDSNPYQTVGSLELPPQVAWSAGRARFFDESLSFQPANSLAAHRPLGQVMRARLFVYERLAELRQQLNGAQRGVVRSLEEVPD